MLYLADVIAIYMIVVDVITTKADVIAFCIIYGVGWCYCQWVADLIATFSVMWWQMLLPSGRCYGHCRVGDGTVADVITTGQMVLPWVSILL